MENANSDLAIRFLEDAEVYKLAVNSSNLGVWGYDVASGKLLWSRKPVSYTHLTLPTTPYV